MDTVSDLGASDLMPMTTTQPSGLPRKPSPSGARFLGGSFTWGTRSTNGYNPARIWYLSTTGNDSTCALNNASLPCLTWGGVWGKHTAGDVVMIRGGTYNQNSNYDIGASATSATAQDLLIAYPGELPILDHTTSGSYYGIEGGNNYTTIDGIKVQNTDGVGSGIGINLSEASALYGNIIRNCEIRDYYRGIWGIAALQGLLIERNVIHDNPGEHNILLGAKYRRWRSGCRECGRPE